MTGVSEPAAYPNLLPKDGRAWLIPDALDTPTADRLFEVLVDQIEWRQEHVRLMGREIPVPRLTAWYGDAAYAYSGIAHPPRPWLPQLAALAERVGTLAGTRFDSVLANLYRTGRDSIAWHSDDEPELGDDPIIASLSLGAVRRFRLRHRYERGLGVGLDLPHGSCLVMGPGVQRAWAHSLPKTAKPVGPRLNLTFRKLRHT
ncbi:MAG: alpha-ketoglutarate-dependent dioxygenase AlkB family protein [Pseudomonadota bacterium]